MKYTAILTVALFTVLLFAYADNALAVGKDFGGKISSTTFANVTCTGGTGPTTIKPVGAAATQYYFFPISTKGGTPQSSKMFLGKYSGESSNCIQKNGIEEHIFPTINVTLYGISKQVQMVGGRYK